MDDFELKVKNRLEEMQDEIDMHKKMHMENEGVFIEYVDEKPVEKSLSQQVDDLLKDFPKC